LFFVIEVSTWLSDQHNVWWYKSILGGV